MEKSFPLATPMRKRLWTREIARPLRGAVEDQLAQLGPGDILVIDMKGIEAFDYSFANEFFGKAILSLPKLYPERFLIVDGLNEYTRENLKNALESLGLAMIERHARKLRLIGKIHPTDTATFEAIAQARHAVTAAFLRDLLQINVTAVNERLAKLASLGLVRRRRGSSAAGREQYEYSVLA
jgi:predicted transcriptional regulator